MTRILIEISLHALSQAPRAMVKTIFSKAIKLQRQPPETISLDGYANSQRAMREMKTNGTLPEETKIGSSEYLRKLIEQDHRNIKSGTYEIRGLKQIIEPFAKNSGVAFDASHSQRAGKTS